MFLSKDFEMEVAHHLPNYDGACSRVHGHTVKLSVTIKGDVGSNGMVLDYKILKKIVQESVIDRLDHNYLNNILENPTSENLVQWIAEQIQDCPLYKAESLGGVLFPRFELYSIKLWETSTSYCEWVKE